jgi:histidine triad (HIT) family protein
MSDCLFCKIVAGEVPATLVRESERTLAFRDVNGQAPTHVLVVSRAHHETIGALAADDPETLVELVRETAAVAEDESLAESGWRLVFNTGRAANQTVPHVHAHVLGGRGFSWPPG